MAISQATARQAWERLRTADEVRYFFAQLSLPEWIEPLVVVGAFANPPARSEGFSPPWPQSEYLARMASEHPEVALIGFDAVPPVENARIRANLVDVLSTAAPDLAAARSRPVREWLLQGHPEAFDLPMKTRRLMVHLAEGGHCAESLRLLRALLEVEPSERPGIGLSADTDSPTTRAEATSRFDEWVYGEILDSDVPRLVAACGLDVVVAIAWVLDEALRIEHGEEAKEDYSFLWRPSIAEHDQNWDHLDLKERLVVALRDGVDRLLDREPSHLASVAESLRRFNWPVYRRLWLYTLARHGAGDPALADEGLSDVQVLGDRRLLPELKLLARCRLPHASGATRVAYYEGVLAQDLVAERKTDGPSAQQREEWQYRLMVDVVEWLPDEARSRFEGLAANYGHQEHTDFIAPHASFVGPTSPISSEELRALDPLEVVAYLAEWVPDRGFGAPSEEGLGRELAAVVEDRPTDYSDAAEAFVEADATYVRALLTGLRSAAKTGGVSWEPVLGLGAWLVAQPRGHDRTGHDSDRDTSWGPTRGALMRLLEEAMADPQSGLNGVHAERVWGLIGPVAEDPDPSPEDEAQYGHPNMDPLTYSINTVRGQAMHAAAAFAWWASRIEGPSDWLEKATAVLGHHLSPEVDPSPAVHSVFGWWLPWLLVADEAWVSDNLSLIFPEDGLFFDAAWTAYLARARRGEKELSFLRPYYHRAIGRLGSDSGIRLIGWKDQGEALIDRLVLMYAAGEIGLDDELLEFLWEAGAPPIAARALKEAGRRLYTDETVTPEIAARLMELWEKRSELRPLSAEEATAFGWWFASDKVEPSWSLPILVDLLPQMEDERHLHLILERLAAVAPAHPQLSLRALRAISLADQRNEIAYHREDTRAILEAAMGSDDERIRRDALDLADRLGRRGLTELKGLLDGTPL